MGLCVACVSPEGYGVRSVQRISMGSSSTSLGLCLPTQKATLAQVGETVVSWCFAGCLGQARNRCMYQPLRYGRRNYASDVRPTDALAADVEFPSQVPAAPGVVLCPATARLKKTTIRSRRVVTVTIRKMLYWTLKVVVFNVKFHLTLIIF